LIRVGAAGLNYADASQSRGLYQGGPVAPYAAGFEAAGEIVEIGSGIAHPLPKGAHVVGAGAGAFAEYMLMPASGAHPVPAGWTDAAALGLVLNWATALAALRPLGEIHEGETVLVHAGAGGVGQAAVRLARHFGARVIATASPEKHEAVHALGASEVIDARRPDLAEQVLHRVGRVDLVLESIARRTLRTSLTLARPFTGRVIVFGQASGPASVSTDDLIFTHHAQIKGLHIGALATDAPHIYRSVITEIYDLIARGVYPPGTPTVHPLADGPSVLEQLERGETIGKLALDPWM
jgi:NADPH:quinone reductase-like Zn-dependent oxidoreductase